MHQKKLPSHRVTKEIHEKKKYHRLSISCKTLFLKFLQLLNLQRKEDKNSNKANGKNI